LREIPKIVFNQNLKFLNFRKLNYWPAAFVLVIGATGATGATDGGAGLPVGAGMCAGRPY
jgi:hypothetical protein